MNIVFADIARKGIRIWYLWNMREFRTKLQDYLMRSVCAPPTVKSRGRKHQNWMRKCCKWRVFHQKIRQRTAIIPVLLRVSRIGSIQIYENIFPNQTYSANITSPPCLGTFAIFENVCISLCYPQKQIPFPCHPDRSGEIWLTSNQISRLRTASSARNDSLLFRTAARWRLPAARSQRYRSAGWQCSEFTKMLRKMYTHFL